MSLLLAVLPEGAVKLTNEGGPRSIDVLQRLQEYARRVSMKAIAMRFEEK
jgi:hypothetical protein